MSDCFASRDVTRCIAKAKSRKRYKLAQIVKTYLDTDAVPPAAMQERRCGIILRSGVQAEKWSSLQSVAGTRGRRSTPPLAGM